MTLADDLEQKYEYRTDAEALFFRTLDDTPSFRFEIPSLGWEFSDGFYIGSDFKGTFYYGNLFVRLPRDVSTQGSYLIVQHRESANGPLHVHIKFTTADGNILGEFYARDPHNVSEPSGLLNVSKEGGWKKVSYVTSTASAAKESGSTIITIRSPGLHKRGTIECGEHDQVKNEQIDVDGVLTIQDIQTLHGATSVRWYRDHAVFYEDQNSESFSAFFFPEEGHNDPLGSDNNLEWLDAVTWQDV